MITTPAVRAQAQSLDALLQKFIGDADLPTYAQGHLGRYACIAAAGFLENALAEVMCHYVKSRAQPAVASYSMSALRKVQNPNAGKFVEVVSRFDRDWGVRLEDFLASDAGRRKGAIDSIMSNRHLIAHGKNSGITLRQVDGYVKSSIEALQFIESLF